jgi:hypothetical protein
MKNKLKLLLTITFIFSVLGVFGQHCSVTSDQTSLVSLRVKSTEVSSVNGQVTMQIVVKVHQKIYFPSLPYLDNEFSSAVFSEQANSSSNSAPDTLQEGDSLIHSITISYDANSLPYYPADIVLAFNDTLKRKAKLYFTPYSTLEVQG